MAQLAPVEIFYAAAGGNARQVQEWLAGGGDANAEANAWHVVPRIIDDGLRLLGAAAWHGQSEIIRLLLTAGADVNYSNRSLICHNALLLAVMNGKFDAARVLVENGADVNFDCNNPTRLDPPPRCRWPRDSVAEHAAGHFPRILKMLLKAGLNTAARSCHTPRGLDDTPEEYVRRHLEYYRNDTYPLEEIVEPLEESLEILERLRLAEWHPLSQSRPFEEFPPFKALLWNRAFGSNRVGPRTTAAVARLFGRNKTGALADVPDGVFWLIMQFFVAGEMRPHVTPVASTLEST